MYRKFEQTTQEVIKDLPSKNKQIDTKVKLVLQSEEAKNKEESRKLIKDYERDK